MYNAHGNYFGHTRRYSKVMWVKWNLVLVCLEIVLISAQDRCVVSVRMYHRRGNYFGHTQWYTYVTWVNWKLVLFHLEIVLI
jgi:hypothetical protein